jgi:hypothetical protein
MGKKLVTSKKLVGGKTKDRMCTEFGTWDTKPTGAFRIIQLSNGEKTEVSIHVDKRGKEFYADPETNERVYLRNRKNKRPEIRGYDLEETGEWHKKSFRKPTHFAQIERGGDKILDYYTGKATRSDGHGNTVYQDVELYLVQETSDGRFKVERYDYGGAHWVRSYPEEYYARSEFNVRCRAVWHDDIERLTKKGYDEGVNPDM